MDDRQDPRALKARYVFPVDAPPIPDGVVTTRAGRIVAVGRTSAGPEPEDLGNAAIIPGLVNAHTHLEWSHLESPLGKPGMALPDWIRAVVVRRRRSADAPSRRSISTESSTGQGLVESARSGTTTLGDIVRPGFPLGVFEASPVGATLFLELIGLAAERVEPLLQAAREHIRRGRSFPEAHRAGVSPHAPYTAHPELVSRLADLSSRERVPVAMHLAESREEIELLRSGSGPFRKLLVDLDAWHGAAIPRRTRPLDYLRLLERAHRALVIHGNYLDEEEIDFLARRRRCMSVVYCPRTHAYFRHADYPLGKMLAAGVCVALGTDSRASNPDLSLLAEMRCVARRRPDIPLETVLALGTAAGAKALGREQQIGTITPGKQADLTVVPLPDGGADDPHRLLFDATAPVRPWRR